LVIGQAISTFGSKGSQHLKPTLPTVFYPHSVVFFHTWNGNLSHCKQSNTLKYMIIVFLFPGMEIALALQAIRI
jgi:hypothetical protein